MKLVVVYNSKSGGKFDQRQLEQLMKDTSVSVIDWIPVNDQLAENLRIHIDPASTIAVVGGDGTQRAVAELLVNTEATLMPLPGGTLNHFARDLGVPQSMPEALQRIGDLKPLRIDTAIVNGKLYLNNSSIGLYPRALLERQKTERLLGKWPASISASLHALVWFRRYRLMINGKSYHTPFVFIGNNNYQFEKSLFAERSQLISGHLTVFILRSWSRVGMARAALFDRLAKHFKSKSYEINHPKKVVITMKKPTITVSLDGEIERLTTPLSYEVQPKSLKVLV